ncbi:MAG: AbrB/MazE/SpoVT family DNA-binding domain-containing protein, partial [Calditrichota bacterium]
MVRKLISIGDDYGVVIERPIAELLNISPETELEVTTNGVELIIRPAVGDHTRRVKKVARKMI